MLPLQLPRAREKLQLAGQQKENIRSAHEAEPEREKLQLEQDTEQGEKKTGRTREAQRGRFALERGKMQVPLRSSQRVVTLEAAGTPWKPDCSFQNRLRRPRLIRRQLGVESPPWSSRWKTG
uniref:Uncharacterized protein n=1 Tax=Sphaerodactylus townsendi TaxID=933632 RepID=A0ACB8FC25_9SAUR